MDSKDEVPIIKKEISYTYWVDKDKQQNPNNQPAKVPQQIDVNNHVGVTVQKHVSSWNSSGTWEEKKLKDTDMKEVLEVAFQKKPIPALDSRIEFYDIEKCEGESSIVAVRGKKRLGFHLKINILYRGIGGCKGAEGVFKYTSFSDDGDRDFEVSTTNNTHRDICRKSAQDSNDILEKAIIAAFQEFTQ